MTDSTAGAALRDRFLAGMRANLEHAMKAGRMRKEDPALAAHAILGLYAECILYWAAERGKDWDKLAEFLAVKLQKKVDYTFFPQATGFVRMTLGSHRCDVIMGLPQGDDLIVT